MGEISDALRRAREAERERLPAETTPRSPRRPSGAEALLAEPPDTVRDPVEISTSVAGNWVARAVLLHPRGALAEQYRHAAIRLRRALRAENHNVIGITSAQRGEGKTTTSCNLALALASMAAGRRVALVELDMRRPCHSEVLGIEVGVGIEEVLAGDRSLSEARHPTQFADLDLYPVGNTPTNPLDLLAGNQLNSILTELGKRYEIVIIDTPPVLPVPDLPLVLPALDRILLVARSGVTRTGAMKAVCETIDRNKILGAFVNEGQRTGDSRYYGYDQNPYYEEDDAEAVDG